MVNSICIRRLNILLLFITLLSEDIGGHNIKNQYYFPFNYSSLELPSPIEISILFAYLLRCACSNVSKCIFALTATSLI